MRLAGVALLQLFLLADAVSGADITNNNFKITRSPLSELLSQQTVRQSFQDDAGLLWFLTQEGLHRFDGYEVRTYQASGALPDSITHNNVHQILQDHSGKIWIATIGGGLNYYDPKTRSFTAAGVSFDRTGLLSNNLSSIIEDDSGYIWIGYLEGAISRYDPFERSVQHLETLNRDAKLNGVITSFESDGAEIMWIGTSNGGLIRFNHYTGEITRYRAEASKTNALSSDHITTLVKDAKDRLWIGTGSEGLILMKRTTGEMIRLKNRPDQESSLSNNSINIIYRDRDERIWIGTDGGLNLHDEGDRFLHFTDKNSNLGNNLVRNIMQDQQGNFWIGTHYGLFTGFQSKFDIFDSKRGLPANSVTSFAETRAGDLWIGSYNGLFHYEEATKSFQKASSIFKHYSLPDNRIMSIVWENSRLWVGTRNHGVEVIDTPTGTVRSFNTESSEKRRLNNDAIVHIAVVRDGSTWISTFGGGINKISPNQSNAVEYHTRVESGNSISSDYVMKIFETAQNRIYIATTVGLNRYDATDFTVVPLIENDNESFLPAKIFILDIHQDINGNIWLGTQHGGLRTWNVDQVSEDYVLFEEIKTTPPLPSSTVYAIEEDSEGYLWLSTTNGLVRLDPATRQIITFDYSDGLQDNEFNFGASFKDSQGRLYFGGNKGYNRFRPEEVVQKSDPPPMVMTNVIIAGEAVAFDPAYRNLSTLHLDYEDTFVNFEFSALDYTGPQKNRYQYQLENFDAQWVDIGARHNISFTGLPSGIYQLRIKGANSEGAWNHEGLNLTMKVHPAPWLSWWAFSCYGAIMLWLVWFFRKYYDNYLLKERATKDAASMHVTAERAMDDLQDQLEIEQTLIRNVRAHSRNTMDVLQDLLNRQAEAIGDESTLELFTDNQSRFSCLQQLENNLYYMVDRLEVNFRAFVEDLIAVRFNRQIHTNVDIAVVNETNEVGISAAIAVPAAMITNELFCNSIKHAFDAVKGVHYIRIALEENIQLNGWTLEVSDSGSGLPESIDPNNPTTLGMELVLHFTRLLNAELTVTRHEGTHFKVNIPKPAPFG